MVESQEKALVLKERSGDPGQVATGYVAVYVDGRCVGAALTALDRDATRVWGEEASLMWFEMGDPKKCSCSKHLPPQERHATSCVTSSE